jgi:DNA-binding XRE family transcriptional regulator
VGGALRNRPGDGSDDGAFAHLMWYNPSIVSTDFSSLIADIEHEAQDEGPLAVRELEQFREEFSLASQLIESRREGKLSQRQLAKLSGVPQSEISRIETGTSNPTYATITALLRPLGKRVQLVDGRKVAARKAGAAPARRPNRTGAKRKASRSRKPAGRKPTAKTP